MSQRKKKTFCELLKPCVCCAAPTPRETNNYYNRHHLRDEHHDTSICKGNCYCPPSCRCTRHSMNGRYVETLLCEDDDEEECCICGASNKKTPRPTYGGGCGGGYGGGGGAGGGGGGGTRNTCGSCSKPRSPRTTCSPPHRQPPKCPGDEPEPNDFCFTGDFGSKDEKSTKNECCPPCCQPYKPAKRKPICYPPIKCCEGNECGQSPTERICYNPMQVPKNPKYCTCGSANPCDCDMDARRRAAICENTPCCRRCGRKVYAAERICAAQGAFHTSCYSCYCCHKPLEVTNVYENQGEIYCKQCYTRYFGISGYGYGNKSDCPCKECFNN